MSGVCETCFGTYILQEVIGTGAFSRVYKSKFISHGGDEMEMAIKSFSPIDSASENNPIDRDIQHGRDPRLRSEYTIIYHEQFDMLKCVSVSMPLMKMSLKKYIHSQEILSDDKVLLNITQIVLGVCFLHHNSVTHFDLKPENILIDSNSRLKVADFGESRLFAGEVTGTFTQQIGTFTYMAPELMDDRQRGKCTFKCDIFSMALILYELMEKKSPRSPLNAMEEARNGKVNPLTIKRSQPIIDLYESMREINPSDRPCALELLFNPIIYNTIVTHDLPIPPCLLDFWKMFSQQKKQVELEKKELIEKYEKLHLENELLLIKMKEELKKEKEKKKGATFFFPEGSSIKAIKGPGKPTFITAIEPFPTKIEFEIIKEKEEEEEEEEEKEEEEKEKEEIKFSSIIKFEKPIKIKFFPIKIIEIKSEIKSEDDE